MKNEELDIYLKELKELTEIESPTNCVQGVKEVGDYLINKGKEFGFQSKIIPLNSSEVADCVLISNNLKAQKFDILFVAHMDTVFPVGSKSEDNFVQNGDKINALGIIDDKAGALLALYAMRDLNQTGKNFALFLNSHEETGSALAQEAIKDLAKKSEYAFVMEPARSGGEMVATRKGMVIYQVDFKGVAAHAGNAPQLGKSALVEMANFIVEVSKLNDYKNGVSVNCVVTNGGTAENVIAEDASLRMEMRYRDPSSIEKFEKELDEVLARNFIDGVTKTKSVILSKSPMNDVEKLPKIKELFDKIANKIKTEAKWVDAGGLSDGNIAAQVGCTTIDGLGPTGGNMHVKSEYLVVSSVIPKCNLIVEVAKELLEN